MASIKSMLFKRKSEELAKTAAAKATKDSKSAAPASKDASEGKDAPEDAMEKRIRDRMGMLETFQASQKSGGTRTNIRGSVNPQMMAAAVQRNQKDSDGPTRSYQLRNHSMFPNEKQVLSKLENDRKARNEKLAQMNKKKGRKRVTFTIKG